MAGFDYWREQLSNVPRTHSLHLDIKKRSRRQGVRTRMNTSKTVASAVVVILTSLLVAVRGIVWFLTRDDGGLIVIAPAQQPSQQHSRHNITIVPHSRADQGGQHVRMVGPVRRHTIL